MARRYNDEYYYDDDPDDYSSDPEELRRQVLREKRRRREERRRRRYRQWLIKTILTVVGSLLAVALMAFGCWQFYRYLENRMQGGSGSTVASADNATAGTDGSGTGDGSGDGTGTVDGTTDGTDGTDADGTDADGATGSGWYTADDNTVYLTVIHRDDANSEDVPEATSSEADTSSDLTVSDTDFDQQFIDASKAIGMSGEGNDYVASEYAILVNVDTGEIVMDRDATTRMVPASMTKVLTALVAAEHITDESQLQDKVTITQDIVDRCWLSDSSSMYYIDGDEISVEELFYGTILQSGADAAFALANYTAGSEEAFVQLMNDKLEELGISETTHFTNPVGIYDEDHYSTCYDMAVIMQAAMENEFCRKILSTRSYEAVPSLSYPDGGHVVSNWFLRRIEDKDTHGTVVGAKTGYVSESGCCAVSYQTSDDGTNYICVTADSWGSWRTIYDHVAIYSHFTN